MSCNKYLIALLAMAGASACTPVDRGFGEALRYDMALQTIDPDPVYPAEGAKPGDSGAKGAAAVEAYRKGQTKALRIERSTASGTGTGSGTSTGN